MVKTWTKRNQMFDWSTNAVYVCNDFFHCSFCNGGGYGAGKMMALRNENLTKFSWWKQQHQQPAIFTEIRGHFLFHVRCFKDDVCVLLFFACSLLCCPLSHQKCNDYLNSWTKPAFTTFTNSYKQSHRIHTPYHYIFRATIAELVNHGHEGSEFSTNNYSSFLRTISILLACGQ